MEQTNNDKTLKVICRIFCNDKSPQELGFILKNDEITNKNIRRSGNMVIVAIAQQLCPPPDGTFKPLQENISGK